MSIVNFPNLAESVIDPFSCKHHFSTSDIGLREQNQFCFNFLFDSIDFFKYIIYAWEIHRK